MANVSNGQSETLGAGRKREITSSLLAGIAALGLIGAAFLSFYLLTVDDHESRTTDTKSTQLKTSAERVAFLSRYFKFRTPVTDAAFHIVYHDNSVGNAGPSDWRIAAALLMTPADGPAWLTGARPIAANEALGKRVPTTAGLIPAEWQVSTTGERYTRDGALLVWHSEGVLEFATATN